MKKLLALFLCSAALLVGQVAIPAGTSFNITDATAVPSGGTPAYGPGSSTDYALAAWNGTGGNLLRNTGVITDANGDLTMPSTATTGLRLYNNVGLTEWAEFLWASNQAILRTTLSGGSSRALVFQAVNGPTQTLSTSGFAFNSGVQSNPNLSGAIFTIGSNSATSGTDYGMQLLTTYNQASGNAANTDLLINRTQTAVGSGEQDLIDAQVATVSQFRVTNAGVVYPRQLQFKTGNNGTTSAPSLAWQDNSVVGLYLYSGANWNGVGIGGGTNTTTSSGTNVSFAVTPIYNQASGGATNTDLLINRTQTAVGSGAQNLIDAQVSTVSKFSVSNAGVVAQSGKTTIYNGVTTAGIGTVIVVAAGRVTAQSAANASISTYTTPASDGSYEVSANMNVTAATALSTTLTCTYTDESNTARTLIFPVTQLSGSFIALGAVTGTGAWETPTLHIRCKASTAITILTSAGTFNTVTYTAEGIIRQLN